MGWFILLAAAIIITGGALIAKGATTTQSGRWWAIGVAAGTPVLFLLITVLLSGHTVENGHIGIVKQFGAIRGTTGDSLVFTAPWKNLSQVSVRGEPRTYVMDDRPGAPRGASNSGAAVSKDSRPVYLVLQINYQLLLSGAVDVFKQTGGQYVERILDPQVYSITKEVTAE